MLSPGCGRGTTGTMARPAVYSNETVTVESTLTTTGRFNKPRSVTASQKCGSPSMITRPTRIPGGISGDSVTVHAGPSERCKTYVMYAGTRFIVMFMTVAPERRRSTVTSSQLIGKRGVNKAAA